MHTSPLGLMKMAPSQNSSDLERGESASNPRLMRCTDCRLLERQVEEVIALVEQEQWEVILNVHYFHDLLSHARGWQFVHEKIWHVEERDEAPTLAAGLRSRA